MVVVRHVLQYSVSDEGGILTNVIWAIQMPGFILISGYFAAKPNKSICKQVIKNSQRYFLPFISWWILISVLLLGACGRSLQIGINKLIYHVDGGLWFLWVVFVLSILASIINKIFSTDFKLMKKISSAVMVGCVFYSVLFVIAFFTHDINILGIKLILYYSVFYECGYLLKWTEKIWKSKWYKYKNVVVFFSLALFLTIVYNYDLYHCDDNILSIALRMVAGFTGNIVLYNTIDKFKNIINKIELDQIGKYTLEIYTTHMYVNNLLRVSSKSIFWSTTGFFDFITSMIFTCIFTGIIILVFKSVPIANFLMFGKK